MKKLFKSNAIIIEFNRTNQHIAMDTKNVYVNHRVRFDASQDSLAAYNMADENQCKNFSQEPDYVDIDETDSQNKKGKHEDRVLGAAGSCAY